MSSAAVVAHSDAGARSQTPGFPVTPAAPGDFGVLELHPPVGIDRTRFNAEVRQAERLMCELGAPDPLQRGNLQAWLEAGIERQLERVGALPLSDRATTSWHERLADQIYRARLVGADGLALAFGDLTAIADEQGRLTGNDSLVLHRLLRAASDQPLHVYFDPACTRLMIFPEPVPFGQLWTTHAGRPPTRIEYPLTSALQEQLASPGLAWLALPELECFLEASSVPAAPRAPISLPPAPATLKAHPCSDEGAFSASSSRRMLPDRCSSSSICPEPPAAGFALAADCSDGGVRPGSTEESGSEFAFAGQDAARDPLGRATAAHPGMTLAERRQCATELTRLQGPKPFSTIERLFTGAYTPLLDAIANGCQEAFVLDAVSEFARGFEKSYSAEFAALCRSRKRPTMTADIADLALKLSRLHGARHTELVCVDAMRHDLGLRVEQSVHERLQGLASCAERFLAWSALPSTTATQLQVIGRGPCGLHDLSTEFDEEALVNRGPDSQQLRRLRTGSRELLKLDLIEAELSHKGGCWLERRERLAAAVAEVIARHLSETPPKTLVMVFGDHGFQIDAGPSMSSAARQGGATPEEVFVPVCAWLTQGVH